MFVATLNIPAVSAQTAPLPGVAADRDTGFLPRTSWFLSFARLDSQDPQFSWTGKSRFDVDLVGYPAGRVNLLLDDELVLGRERRQFDLNHQNLILETSASARLASIDVAL